jgi:hypothetical protein
MAASTAVADMDFPKDQIFLTGLAAVITSLAGLLEGIRRLSQTLSRR